ELRQLLAKHAAKGRAREGRAGRLAAVQQVDPLEVLALAGLHRADDGKPVQDRGALRHQLADVDARQLRGDAAEGTARRAARLGVPGLELAGRAAEPEKDAVLLLARRLRRKGRHGEETAEAENAERSLHRPFQEEPAMDLMLRTAA